MYTVYKKIDGVKKVLAECETIQTAAAIIEADMKVWGAGCVYETRRVEE